jgi:hypothetical protein
MFSALNGLFGSLDQPLKGSSQPTNQPYIPDTRIRFILTGIYFHQDDNGWSNLNSVCGRYSFQNYSINPICELNVFIVGNTIDATGCGAR